MVPQVEMYIFRIKQILEDIDKLLSMIMLFLYSFWWPALFQISKALTETDKKELMRRLPKFIYDEEKALEVSLDDYGINISTQEQVTTNTFISSSCYFGELLHHSFSYLMSFLGFAKSIILVIQS